MEQLPTFMDRLGLTLEQHRSAVRLAARLPDPDFVERRGATRYRWIRPRRVHADVQPPDGIKRSVVLYPVDLSATGAGVLYWAFLPFGSRCTLHLGCTDDGPIDIEASVVRCRLLRGKVHEVGMRFDEYELSEPLLRWMVAGME